MHVQILLLLITILPVKMEAKTTKQHSYQHIWQVKQQLYDILQNYIYTTLSYQQLTLFGNNHLTIFFDQHIKNEYLKSLNEIQDNLLDTIKTLHSKKEVSSSNTIDTILEDESDIFLINTKKSLNKKSTLSMINNLQQEYQVYQDHIKHSNTINLQNLQTTQIKSPTQKISHSEYLTTQDHYLTIEEDAIINDTQYISGYGHTILLTLKNGKQYLYGKLKQVFVRKGEHIIAGDHIAFSPDNYQTLKINP